MSRPSLSRKQLLICARASSIPDLGEILWCAFKKNVHSATSSLNLNSNPALSLRVSPVHTGVEGLHCVKINVSVVATDCEHSTHDRGHAHSASGRGQLRDVVPAAQTGVQTFHGTQRGVVIKTA